MTSSSSCAGAGVDAGGAPPSRSGGADAGAGSTATGGNADAGGEASVASRGAGLLRGSPQLDAASAAQATDTSRTANERAERDRMAKL